MNNGVPHGIVLAFAIFFLYINDLSKCVLSGIRMPAVDTMGFSCLTAWQTSMLFGKILTISYPGHMTNKSVSTYESVR